MESTANAEERASDLELSPEKELEYIQLVRRYLTMKGAQQVLCTEDSGKEQRGNAPSRRGGAKASTKRKKRAKRRCGPMRLRSIATLRQHKLLDYIGKRTRRSLRTRRKLLRLNRRIVEAAAGGRAGLLESVSDSESETASSETASSDSMEGGARGRRERRATATNQHDDGDGEKRAPKTSGAVAAAGAADDRAVAQPLKRQGALYLQAPEGTATTNTVTWKELDSNGSKLRDISARDDDQGLMDMYGGMTSLDLSAGGKIPTVIL